MSRRRIFLAALAAAAWTGVAEEVPIFLESRVGAMVHVGQEFVWMTPLGDLVFFVAAAAVLVSLGRVWPRMTSRPAVVGTFSGLVTAALLPERIHPVAVLLLAVGVGMQLGRWSRAEPKRPRALPWVAATGVLVVLALTGRASWKQSVWRSYWLEWLPPAATGAPNVLLLILDTVRAASVNVGGGGADGASDWPAAHTPALGALAARSTVFTRAIAPSPWTLPSHASMFTGRWPTELWAGRPPGADWAVPLDGRYTTVAEALARSGYRTAGFVANLTYAGAETGLVRGFLDYEDYPVSLGQVVLSCGLGRRIAGYSALRRLLGWHELLNRKSAADIGEAFLTWEAGHGDRPFFAFLNFFDAHEPHFPPDSVVRALPLGSVHEDYDHYAGLLMGNVAGRADKWAMTGPDRAAYASGYNEAILRIDREIGSILSDLRGRGVLDNTLVIVAGDHGEQLGEHGLYNHDNSLYMTTLHVPLIVYDPRDARAARVDEVVSLRDLAPTILDLVGVDPEAAGVGGTSLRPYLPGKTSSRADPPAFATLSRGGGNNLDCRSCETWYPITWGPAMYSLVDTAYHYVLNGDGSEELFDLRRDPGEHANLAGDTAIDAVVEGFREELRKLETSAAPPKGAPARPRATKEPAGS